MISKSQYSVPRVGIVILNFKKAHLTVACVKSFKKVNYSNYRVLVIDNGSGRKEVEFLRQQLPDIQILYLRQNRGYTGGNNQGAGYFLERNFDYVLILNNDTLVTCGGFIGKLVSFCEAHPRVGIVAPSHVLKPDGTYQPMATWLPTFTNRLRFHLGKPLEKVVPNGTCMMVRSDLMREIGLFDESYFCYGEEEDLALRALSAGWKTALVPTERVIHLRDAHKNFFGWASVQMRRNRVLFLRRRRNNLQAVILLILYAFHGLIKVLACPSGQALSGYSNLIKVLGDLWKVPPKIAPQSSEIMEMPYS